MNRALSIAILASGILGILGADWAYADSPHEKYRKYMKKYHEHMEEAHEEAEDGDWDDYHEELGKAQRDYWKAQRYVPRHQCNSGYRGGYHGSPHGGQRHIWGYPSPRRHPGSHGGGYYGAPSHSYHGGGCRSGRGHKSGGGFFGIRF